MIVKYFNAETQLAIVRCSRDAIQMLQAALPTIDRVRAVPCHCVALALSGTFLIACKEEDAI